VSPISPDQYPWLLRKIGHRAPSADYERIMLHLSIITGFTPPVTYLTGTVRKNKILKRRDPIVKQ